MCFRMVTRLGMEVGRDLGRRRDGGGDMVRG